MNNLLSTRSYENRHTVTGFIRNNLDYFQNSFQYHIHLSVDLNKHSISDNLQSLQTLMRSLINGKQTINAIDNRTFFSSHFFGGWYKISITQPSPKAFPKMHYNIVGFSKQKDLEKMISSELSIRLNKIILNVQINQFREESCNEKEIDNLEREFEKINSDSGFYFSSEPVRSLPSSYINSMYHVMHQPVKTFGIIYKRLHMPYLY